MRWVKAVAAALAMLTVLVGAPFLLLTWGSLRPAWWRADDGSLLFTVLTVAGWLAWLAFLLATVLEIVRYAGGNRFIPDLPLLGGLQALCAMLVLAVVSVAGWSQAEVGSESADRSRPTPQAGTVAVPAAEEPDSAGTAQPLTRLAEQPVADEGYTIETGDDLWSVAERLLGEGRRWRELARANPDLLADPTGQLTAGNRLRLPAPPAEKPKRITVERGDTLSGLAREHLGSARHWPKIAAANADLISDPDHIEIGWKLVIPQLSRPAAKPASTPASESPPTTETQAPPPAEPWKTPPPTAESSPVPERTAPPVPAVTAAPDSAPPSQEPPAAEAETTPDRAVIGSLGALAAAGLMGGWQARRLLQSRVRPPGRRMLPVDADLARLHAAVGRRQYPDRTALLDAALRAIGHHFHQSGRPLPILDRATIAPGRIVFAWTEPAGPPTAGFGGNDTRWWVEFRPDGTSPLEPVEHPCAFPALVSLGTSTEGEIVLVDLERSGVVGVAAENRELQLASIAAMAVELACAPWASELALVSVGAEGGLVRAAGGDPVEWLPDRQEALTRLRRSHAERSRELEGRELRRLRTDPERADAVAPQVYVFHDPLDPAQRQELDELLTGPVLGLAAVVAAESDAGAQWELFGDPLHPQGRFGGGRLDAHAIPASTRSAVASWYQVAESTRTEPAPWWSEEAAPNLRLLPTRHPPSEDSVDIVSLRRLVRPHPTLQLIGPIELTGAAGPEPSRSRYQLIEMCSWLLENPGRTATQMAAGLGIAESTRRSNLSRLRAWLGADSDGEPYLPDAYSGRIGLHPQVTSDVHQLRVLTGPGVNRISEDGLVSALELVRGAVLADAVPGQWFWAEELRGDVIATLRDAALVLVDRGLHRGELDLARWAVERALMVAPEDELLMCARIRIEHAAGDRPAVERHVLRLTQQARALGVDLLPETVMLCQQVMEGRARARRA